MDRRRFLRTSALTAGGLLIGSRFLANCSTGKNPTVIIIGGGFSGLAAAYRLYQNDINFTILEARKRIGGRVFSHTIDEKEKLVVELGAEWIGNSHTRIRTLCDELNLNTFNNQFATRLIYKGQYSEKDMWNYSPEWTAKFSKLKEHYKTLKDTDKEAINMDKIDWWRYLVNNGCDGDDLMLRELFDSTDFGESIREVSAYAALGEYTFSDDTNEMDLKIEGGNNQLALAISDRIGADKIKLEHFVDKIQQGTDKKVTVTCTNGAVFKGDYIICTAPTFSVRKMNWDPVLPEETILAIDELQYARINKNVSLYSNRFWKDES
ncbi:MAG TPA: NAD(P)/FAD-dependent oxidoreductase, partial [Bacteroidia bacterium]|nr:NAD(P)/FAD-dependent oxidoreductase [Bacteroidia bacterium]